MTQDDFDALRQMNDAASAAPWHVLFTNDDMCMNAVLVTRNPDTGRITSAREDGWESRDVVAACLVQSPDVAGSSDRRWDENARLIATVRNALPELLRLAAIGMDRETVRPTVRVSDPSQPSCRPPSRHPSVGKRVAASGAGRSRHREPGSKAT